MIKIGVQLKMEMLNGLQNKGDGQLLHACLTEVCYMFLS